MLTGIPPALTGELLAVLDAMGHSDAIVLADAHFPAARLARRLIVVPTSGTPELLRAVRTVVPLDDSPALDLMRSADGELLPVQRELLAAAGGPDDAVRFLGREEFYAVAAEAFAVVRTGETAVYGNVVLRKGVVSHTGPTP